MFNLFSSDGDERGCIASEGQREGQRQEMTVAAAVLVRCGGAWRVPHPNAMQLGTHAARTAILEAVD